MYLYINRFLPFTRVEGPGIRACIWVQGCSIHCSNCSTPWMWPIEGGTKVDLDEIASDILKLSNIEGITFSGGEPFLQAKQIVKLIHKLKKEKNLSIVTYTGYYLDQIMDAKNKDFDNLIKVTDILIDGPYVKDLHVNRPLIGSSNQNIYFLTSMYQHIKDEIKGSLKKLEIHILPDSTVLVNGNVDYEGIKDILNGMILKKG